MLYCTYSLMPQIHRLEKRNNKRSNLVGRENRFLVLLALTAPAVSAAASAEAVSASSAQAAVNGLGSAGSGRGSALFSDQFFLLINPKRDT